MNLRNTFAVLKNKMWEVFKINPAQVWHSDYELGEAAKPKKKEIINLNLIWCLNNSQANWEQIIHWANR